MFKKLSEKVIDFAARNGAVKTEEKEEYIYGLDLFLTSGLNIITIMIIGLAMHMILECICIFFLFRSLRKYVGGYHAGSAWICYFLTTGMFLLMLGILRTVSVWPAVLLPCCVLSAGCMLVLSPVEAINKRLDEVERRVFRKRAWIAIIVFTGLFLAAFVMRQYYVASLVCISMFAVAVLAVIGKIKLEHYCKKTLLNQVKYER